MFCVELLIQTICFYRLNLVIPPPLRSWKVIVMGQHSKVILSSLNKQMQCRYFCTMMRLKSVIPLGQELRLTNLVSGVCSSSTFSFTFIVTGMFYFHLGNVAPKHRSKLSSIQLLCIVKSKHLSLYGMDAVLQPIISNLKKLVCTRLSLIRGEVCTSFFYRKKALPLN